MAKADRNRRWYLRRAERQRLDELTDAQLVERICTRAQLEAEIGHRERLVAAALELMHPTAVFRGA